MKRFANMAVILGSTYVFDAGRGLYNMWESSQRTSPRFRYSDFPSTLTEKKVLEEENEEQFSPIQEIKKSGRNKP